MAEVLQLAQLVDQHRVTEVQVRRGRIEARLDAQRFTRLQSVDQFGLDQQFFAAAFDDFELFFQRWHCGTVFMFSIARCEIRTCASIRFC